MHGRVPPKVTKQNRYRRRQRAGVQVARVEVGLDVLGALIESGRLTEAEALSREAVARDLGFILKQWAAQWTGDR